MEFKICKKCNLEKSIEDFRVYTNKKGIKYICGECKVCYNKRVYNNKVKSGYVKSSVYKAIQVKSTKNYINKNKGTIKYKEKIKYRRLYRKYNLTKDLHISLLEQQHYSCLVCGKHKDETSNGKLYVDHCHVTGLYRGLLCMNCNVLIGHAKDDIKILESAINYLKSR